MSRTTRPQLEAAFRRLQQHSERLGLKPSCWALIEGSKTYGRPFRLVEIDPGTGGHSSVLHGSVPSYLGMTRCEAYEVLNFAGSLLQAIASTDTTSGS